MLPRLPQRSKWSRLRQRGECARRSRDLLLRHVVHSEERCQGGGRGGKEGSECEVRHFRVVDCGWNYGMRRGRRWCGGIGDVAVMVRCSIGDAKRA